MGFSSVDSAFVRTAIYGTIKIMNNNEGKKMVLGNELPDEAAFTLADTEGYNLVNKQHRLSYPEGNPGLEASDEIHIAYWRRVLQDSLARKSELYEQVNKHAKVYIWYKQNLGAIKNKGVELVLDSIATRDALIKTAHDFIEFYFQKAVSKLTPEQLAVVADISPALIAGAGLKTTSK